MGYDRQKVIAIAAAEIGYLEKSKAAYQANPAILDQKTAGAGSDNYTKYGRDMHKIYPAVIDFPAPWCDTLIDWAMYKSYGVATAKSLLGGTFDDYTVASAQAYQKHGALDGKPEVGAQAFFTKNGKVSGCYHTGLVIAVSSDGKTITTIEGNTSATGTNIEANGGCVAKKTRAVTGNTLFGHPNYQDGYGKTTTNSTTNSTNTTTESAKYFSSSVAGTYIVNTQSDPLMMRTGAGTNRKIIVRVPKGAKVVCYGYYNYESGGKVRWLYCVYGSYKGYLCRSYLRLVQA